MLLGSKTVYSLMYFSLVFLCPMKSRMTSGTHFPRVFCPWGNSPSSSSPWRDLAGPAGQGAGVPDIRQGCLHVLELQKQEAQLLQREALRLCRDLEIWVKGHSK